MASPRAAAAVVLVRTNPTLELFWVRRSLQMAFQGGFHAFPGGQLEPGEDARAAAVRELREETGVRVDPQTLRPIGRWVTPAFAPKRFDTFFFLAHLPPGEEARIDTPELDLGEWIEPSLALEQWLNGAILAAPPVMNAVRSLVDGLEGVETRALASPDAHGSPPVEIDMRPGITMVPVRTPTLPPATHTNCYVIGGDEVIVVDPASPYEEEQRMLDAVLERRRVREVWLTHLHRDHVSGANHVRARWKVPVAAHAITRRDLSGVVTTDRTLEDQEIAELSGSPGWRLRVHHTPGHAQGHVCVFEENNGSLITGDLMAGLGTIVIDPPEGHMATYLDSLKRMQALPVTALFPAHGPAMANAKGRIQEYIDHRLWREERILDSWRKGLRSVPEIVKHAYSDVPPAVHGLAERSTVAHIEKLREEGRL